MLSNINKTHRYEETSRISDINTIYFSLSALDVYIELFVSEIIWIPTIKLCEKRTFFESRGICENQIPRAVT